MAWTPQYSRFDKMQSLRIELLYALQRRGNKALGPWATAAADLTQDWPILKMLVELIPQRVELRIWCGSLDRISDRTRQEVPNWPSTQNPMSIRQNTYCIPDNIRKPNGLSSLSTFQWELSFWNIPLSQTHPRNPRIMSSWLIYIYVYPIRFPIYCH